jgi:hypothetical protein
MNYTTTNTYDSNNLLFNSWKGREITRKDCWIVGLNRWLSACLLFVLLSFASRTTAQEYLDIFKTDYAISPNNTFDDSAMMTTLQEMNANLTIPVKINERLALLTGVTYEHISAYFDQRKRKASVAGLTFKLGANIKHGEKWSGTYLLLPKISSDFEKVAKQDVQLGGAVMMKYKKSEHLNYKFGVYVNNELFGVFVVPVAGLYYLSPSGKFEANALLPLSCDLNYSMTSNFRVGLNFKGQVRTYNLNSAVKSKQNNYLARSSNDVYTYLQYGMKSGINLQLGLGHSVGRSYRVYNEKVSMGIPLVYFDDNRQQLNTDFSDGWLIKFAVFYRLNLEKKQASK